ncbi:MAG: nitrite/sulfite reductase [Candidatus Acidiferrales bacterium]
MDSEAGSQAKKETKAQRSERLKREKNPWEALEDIKAFARTGRDSVTPEWLNTYFRWWGIYTQGDGAGALGGAGGEGNSTKYFMLRIPLPNGLLKSRQLRAIANLSARFGRGLADITVRQSIQLHWVEIEAVPEILETLAAEGISPKGACGDVVRNITGCPLAGVAADELIDASPLAREIGELVRAQQDFYNLPRKFKISVTGCPVWCSYPEINDVGLTATPRWRGGRREIGFSLRVGGGLSADPHLSVRLDAFVTYEQAPAVVKAVVEIFRDSDALRDNRKRGRMKHLFTQYGWTRESFLDELNRRLGFTLDPAADENAPVDVFRDHVGVHAQKQPGHYHVGATVLGGRVTAKQMREAADLAERFGSGELRTTAMQNLLIVNVPRANVDLLIGGLNAAGLRVQASPFWRGAIACTGSEFCKLAITETKGFTRWVVEELEERVPEFDQQLKLHVTGCPNSCGQHWISDIGLEGKKIKHNGAMNDAYYFCVGGAVGAFQQVARPIGYRCIAPDVPAAIERALRAYMGGRYDEESLRGYFSRFSDEELRAQFSGEAVSEAVVREAAAGVAPQEAGD